MSKQKQLNNRRDNFLAKINRILGFGNSSVGRINYADPTIPNSAYDLAEGGVQYEDLPPGTRIGPQGNIISEDAPRGLWRVIAGGIDKVLPTDLDLRGEGRNRWNEWTAEPGTVGGVPIEIPVEIENPNYDPTKATNPVPNIGSGLSVGKIAQDAYSGWRDRRIADRGAERNLLYNQIANEYAYNLNKAGMLEALNQPYWLAKTNLMNQQAFAVPRIAKAALIEARAKSQDAANEFGQLGLKRTYFTG